MAKMRAVQVSKPKGPLELVERDIPEPGPGQVRIKVQACGICHSDAFTVEGIFPHIQYPRVPGHEVVGLVDAVGPDVEIWQEGQRVGVGWHGGHCGHCDRCRRGDFITCRYRSDRPASTTTAAMRNTWWRPSKPWPGPRGAVGGGRRPAAVRRHHDLQRPAPQRCPPRRSGCRSRHRRAGPPGRAVRREDGLPHRRHRAGHGQGAARPASSAPTATSTARRKTRRTSLPNWAAPG